MPLSGRQLCQGDAEPEGVEPPPRMGQNALWDRGLVPNGHIWVPNPGLDPSPGNTHPVLCHSCPTVLGWLWQRVPAVLWEGGLVPTQLFKSWLPSQTFLADGSAAF